MRKLFLVMAVVLSTVVSFGAEPLVNNLTINIDPTPENFTKSRSRVYLASSDVKFVFNGTEVIFDRNGHYVSGDVPDFSDGLKEFYFYFIPDLVLIYNFGITMGPVQSTDGENKVQMPVAESYDCDGMMKIDMTAEAKAGLLDWMFDPPLSELSGGISPMPKPEPEPVVYAEGGKIDCSGSTDRIYDANGVDVTSQNGSLPSGVYIVDCEGVKKKVVMK